MSFATKSSNNDHGDPDAEADKMMGSIFDQVEKAISKAPIRPPKQTEDPSMTEDDNSFNSSCSRSFEELEDFKRKLLDDDRLSQIYKLRYNFAERFDNRSFIHPHGTTNFDYKAIPERRKAGFEKFKNKVRQENYAYLSQHPEIRGMISLFIKKLLQVQPKDPAHYLTEFFTTRMSDSRDLKDLLNNEVQQISRYKLSKMKAAGSIKFKSSVDLEAETLGEPPQSEMEGNYLKKLNIGALAQDFYFDLNSVPKRKGSIPEPEKQQMKKGKKKYCGCKDWKLKKNKLKTPVEPDISTMANLTSEEEEGENGSILFGEFELGGEEEEDWGEHPDAERIADELVSSLMPIGGGAH